jgi:hypothetical protein
MDKNREKYLNQLEDYLLGKLDPAQQQELEQAIAQDEALQQELEEEAKIIKGFRQLRFKEMGAIIEEWEEEITEEQAVPDKGKVIGLGRRGWLSIAAALALLIAGWWWLTYRDAPDAAYYQALALAEYERPDLRSTAITKSAASNADSLFEVAYDYFLIQDWEKAEAAIAGIADTSVYSHGAYALQGLISMEQADYEAAVAAFLRSARQGSEAEKYYNLIVVGPPMRVFDTADVEWYMALALLGLGQQQESKRLLRGLVDEAESPKELQEQAKALLDKL